MRWEIFKQLLLFSTFAISKSAGWPNGSERRFYDGLDRKVAGSTPTKSPCCVLGKDAILQLSLLGGIAQQQIKEFRSKTQAENLVFSSIFILLSRESDQCAIRARLGVASHLSTTPRWGNPAKCLSHRHNKKTCRLVLHTVP